MSPGLSSVKVNTPRIRRTSLDGPLGHSLPQFDRLRVVVHHDRFLQDDLITTCAASAIRSTSRAVKPLRGFSHRMCLPASAALMAQAGVQGVWAKAM